MQNRIGWGSEERQRIGWVLWRSLNIQVIGVRALVVEGAGGGGSCGHCRQGEGVRRGGGGQQWAGLRWRRTALARKKATGDVGNEASWGRPRAVEIEEGDGGNGLR